MPQRAENQDSSLILEVERFEHVSAGAERVLLRIDGRYGNRPGKRVLDAMLFVDDGLAVHRHDPLEEPGADADSWLWRAAFDVPVAYLTDERTRFAIESQPGCLIDLPRPGDIARGAAVPLTARAAHTARRYAAAIAVLLAVAVTPGGLPASARTEVLRVHNADGSVVYLTRDGQRLPGPPADAVIIDQGAPAPAPVPAPEPAPEPQPEQPQQPEQPAPQPKQQKDTPADKPSSGSVDDVRAKDHGAKPHKHSAATDPTTADQSAGQPSADTGTGSAAPQQADHKPRPHRHPHHNPAQAAAPQPGTDLQQMPELLAAPGNDDAQLMPLPEAAGTAKAPDPSFDPATATADDLQPITKLDDSRHPATDTHPLPVPTDAPPLIPISPGDSPTVTDEAPKETTDIGRAVRDQTKHQHGHPGAQHETGGTSPDTTPAPVPAPSAGGGNPFPSSGGSFDSLPGPSNTAVPDFVIDSFRVPPFLLSIYQAAGIQYGIRWEVLAAINEIETDYGRNLNVSSAGALGWMQFMPSTWKMYGTDANKDGQRDPYNPVDAIFAAARYLKAAGGDKDVRRAIFAYNHAGWYVDSVMLRAKLIAGYPPDLVGSLTGLTEGRFPVAARARYSADPAPATPSSDPNADRGIDIYSHEGAPVVAVNDGVVKEIGHSKDLGNYVVLQDVYGNQYTYSGLGSVAKLYPVPKQDAKAAADNGVKTVGAHDPKPTGPASAGAQRPGGDAASNARRRPPARHRRIKPATHAARVPIVAVKQRLFAHPQRPVPQRHGGYDQILAMGSKGFETYDSYFARPIGLNSHNATLRRLKKGSRVVASTILGRVAPKATGSGAKDPHVRFEIRPAGKGAPKIDPKPILDGWKLLESTAIYRAKGKNALYGDGNFSIGEAMLLPKAMLAKRVLSDPRITMYPGGRQDIATGQIDRRVLVVLEFLAESGMNPTVSCLKSGHSFLTSSGNVSEHTSGNAVDISAINGVPITGHQERGGITEQAVRRLMQLQGTMQPHQIISLLDFGANTMSLPDHYNHIHVGFQPLFGDNAKAGADAMSVLKPDQWGNLVDRLGQIQNPTVPTKPSRYAIPDRKQAGDK